MTLIVLALVPLAVVRPTLKAMDDPDGFWHILGGDEVLRTQSFVSSDSIGSLADRPWIKHQWLGEVLMALAHRAAGLAGVQWLVSLAAVAILAALWWACLRVAEALPATIAAVIAWGSASASISARPQVWTFVLLAVSTSIWHASAQDGRPRWWLIPLTWVWACAHGMWFLGPLIGGLTLAGSAWTHRAPDGLIAAIRRQGRQWLVLVASVLVAALTPLGLEIFRAPFQVSEVTAYITEWARTDFTSTAPILGLILLALVVGAWLVRSERPSATEVLTVALAAYLLWAHARTVGIAGVLLAPYAAAHLHRLALRRPVERRSRIEGRTLLLGSVAALALAAVVLPRVADDGGRMPLALNQQLEDLGGATFVFNDSMLGGWLLYAHPQLIVGIDTRVETYDPDYVRRYAEALGGRGTIDVADAIQADVALLEEGSPATDVLDKAGWVDRGSDRGWVLLERPAPS